MNSTAQHRWATARADLRARRTELAARKALQQELAAFDSPAALLELSEMLARHDDDAETETIRSLVDWQRAA